MATTIAPSPYKSIFFQIEQVCATWQAQNTITEEGVRLVQEFIQFCNALPLSQYAQLDDFVCLEHEIGEAAKAILAKDYLAFTAHEAEVRAWKESLDTAIAEAQSRERKRKTPV